MFQKIKAKVTDRIELPDVAHITQRVSGAVDAVTERASSVYGDARERLTHPKDAYERAVTESFGELDYMLALNEGPTELTPALVAKLRERLYQKNPF